MNKWVRFDGSNLVSTLDPTDPSTPDFELWDLTLKRIGFETGTTFGGEFDPCRVFLRESKVSNEWLVEIASEDGNLCQCICADTAAMLKFMTQYAMPIYRSLPSRASTEFFERALDVLFDPDHGLRCAQDVAFREQRQREAALLRRQRMAKSKPEGM